jgi:hypothetical protein
MGTEFGVYPRGLDAMLAAPALPPGSAQRVPVR